MSSGRAPLAGFRPRLLLLVPLLAYAIAYGYLAAYHRSLWLWSTVVHENGLLTLLETTFYASHFLGHVPVLTVLALLFAGAWTALGGVVSTVSSGRLVSTAAVALLVLLVVSAVIGLGHFGIDDTADYLGQRKQRPDLFVTGGSWNLHLPSTVIQLALIPVGLWCVRMLFGRSVMPCRAGVGLVVAAVIGTIVVTWSINPDPVAAVAAIFSDPRYLAHSLRELENFALVFYPLPLAVLLAVEPAAAAPRAGSRQRVVMAALATLAVVGIGHQLVVSLGHDIGELAQRPAFAHDGRLSIPYLLASHRFEHFLDSLYFTLLVLLLVGAVGRRVRRSSASPESVARRARLP